MLLLFFILVKVEVINYSFFFSFLSFLSFFLNFDFVSGLSSSLHLKMPNTNNDSDIPERIAAARREAEALKERIKQRKEALADTTCKFFFSYYYL